MAISRKLRTLLQDFSIELSDYRRWYRALFNAGFLKEQIDKIIFSRTPEEVVSDVLSDCDELKLIYNFSSKSIEILASSFEPIKNIKELLKIAREGKLEDFILDPIQICRIIFIAGIETISLLVENKKKVSDFDFSSKQLIQIAAEESGYLNIKTLLDQKDLLLSSDLNKDQILEFIGCNNGYIKLNEYLTLAQKTKNKEIEEKASLKESEVFDIWGASSFFDDNLNLYDSFEEMIRAHDKLMEDCTFAMADYSEEQKRIFKLLKLDIQHLYEFKKLFDALSVFQYDSFLIYQIALNGNLQDLEFVLSQQQALQMTGFALTPAQITELMTCNAGKTTIGRIIRYHQFLEFFDLTPDEIIKIAGCVDGYKNIDFLVIYFREIRDMNLGKADFLPFLERDQGGNQKSRNRFEGIIREFIKNKKEKEEAKTARSSSMIMQFKLKRENTEATDSYSEEETDCSYVDSVSLQGDDHPQLDSEDEENEIQYFLENYTLLGEKRPNPHAAIKVTSCQDILFPAASNKRHKQNNEHSPTLPDNAELVLNHKADIARP